MAAPTFIQATTRGELQRKLADSPWVNTAETSWAVVFVSSIPTAPETDAVRQAAKVCDRVVAVRAVPDNKLPAKLQASVQATLAAAGADALWLPTEVAGFGRFDAGVESLDATTSTLILQAITTVLPNLVVAPRGNVALVRALRNIGGTLGDLFTLRLV